MKKSCFLFEKLKNFEKKQILKDSKNQEKRKRKKSEKRRTKLKSFKVSKVSLEKTKEGKIEKQIIMSKTMKNTKFGKMMGC